MRLQLNLSLPTFGIILIVIASCIAALPFMSSRQADRTMAELQVVGAKEGAYSTVLELLKDAETGQRGFLVAGDEAFLEPYHKGVSGIPAALRELQGLASGPDEHALVERITRTAQSKLDEMAAVIALRKAGRAQEAADAVASRRGKNLMDQVRELIGVKLGELATRRAEVREDLSITLWFNMVLGLVGTVLSFIVVGIALFVARQHLNARARVAREAQRLADSQTEHAQQVESRNKHLSISAQMLHAMDSVNGTDEIAEIIPVFMRKLIPGSSGCVYLYKNSRDFLVSLSTWGDAAVHNDLIKTSQCWGLRLGAMHHASKEEDLYCSHSQCGSHTQVVQTCIPLVSQGEVLGLLVVLVPAELAASVDQSLVKASAEQLGLAISNVSLREKLRRQSTMDGLTGLYNRRYFDEAFVRELSRAERKKTPCAVVMIDLDHFKRVNDTYGHDAGDLVLKETAKLLQERVRTSDVACRYGGEELVLLLPECDAAAAMTCAEDIRLALSGLLLKHGGVPISGISASFGVAAWPEHGEAAAELLKAADRALYTAKQAGRNRVHAAGGATPRPDAGKTAPTAPAPALPAR